MRNEEIEADLVDLSSAEDFLDYFDIAYDPHVVTVNRLHILQRFHDYLTLDQDGPAAGEEWWDYYTRQLSLAYHDFVKSDAQTEKVFKVFKASEPAFVPIEELLK
nr:nitrogenase-stabilizing/protective protein NifW [uncultured Cohaesibacter sp.]